MRLLTIYKNKLIKQYTRNFNKRKESNTWKLNPYNKSN